MVNWAPNIRETRSLSKYVVCLRDIFIKNGKNKIEFFLSVLWECVKKKFISYKNTNQE